MSLTWDEANEAIKDAQRTMGEMERRTNQLAVLVAGKLRAGNVSANTLCKLKLELRNYNMHTLKWKD